jgi:hypothetical protein
MLFIDENKSTYANKNKAVNITHGCNWLLQEKNKSFNVAEILVESDGIMFVVNGDFSNFYTNSQN